MKIASINNKGWGTGEHILMLSKKECKTILKIMSEYCEQNKRKKVARKYLKEFEDNLSVF